MVSISDTKIKVFLNFNIIAFNTKSNNIIKVKVLIYLILYNFFNLVFQPNVNTVFHKYRKKFLLKFPQNSIIYKNIYKIEKYFLSKIKLYLYFFMKKMIFASFNNIFIDILFIKKKPIRIKSVYIVLINIYSQSIKIFFDNKISLKAFQNIVNIPI